MEEIGIGMADIGVIAIIASFLTTVLAAFQEHAATPDDATSAIGLSRFGTVLVALAFVGMLIGTFTVIHYRNEAESRYSEAKRKLDQSIQNQKEIRRDVVRAVETMKRVSLKSDGTTTLEAARRDLETVLEKWGAE